MIAPYDHEALWTKAKVFVNRAMDPDAGRAFDEQALWASAALELLGKAALARFSPSLIAEPTEDGVNILIATGLIQGTAKFSSVRASTIFKRCGRAFRPFSATEAQKFADARNEYLHGSGIPAAAMPPKIWWPRFWALASILITAQDREIEGLVGSDRVSVVEAHLEQNTKNVEHRTESLIERAKQRLSQYRAGTLPAKVQMEWNADLDLRAGLSYSDSETCPACGATGTLEGENILETSYESESGENEEDSGSFWAELTIGADYFSCPTCHLVLDRYELTEQAGLSDTILAVDDEPDYEPDYGND